MKILEDVIKQLNNLEWHDASINEFSLIDRKIQIKLSTAKTSHVIKISIIGKISIDFTEDWGPSKSILEADIQDDFINILMQSGLAILIKGIERIEFDQN